MNVENDDNKCSQYAIKCALYHDKVNRPQRVSALMRIEDNINYSMLKYPTPITGWDLFEEVNKIAVNIYGYELHKGVLSFHPLRASKFNYKSDYRMIDLLFIGDRNIDNDEDKNHYVTIKNFSALMTSTDTKHKTKHYHCRSCLQRFWCENKFKEHRLMDCNKYGAVRSVLPVKDGENDRVHFKNYKNQQKYLRSFCRTSWSLYL